MMKSADEVKGVEGTVMIEFLEAVANVSPARLCGNGLRETPEQQPRMRSPYETLGYSGISFVVNL
jgi:hypothetical protein